MAQRAEFNALTNEQQLVEAAQRDPRHFAELYDAHFDRIYAYAVTRTRDREAAEDITAEVFHQALANLAKFEWRGVPFSAWLYRIASNAIADRAARSAREQAPSQPEAADSVDLEEVEQRAQLSGLMRDLPADQRRVIEMRFMEDKGIRDIAKELGRSEGAVKQLQFRALQNLRDRLVRDPLLGDPRGNEMAERDLIQQLDQAVSAMLTGATNEASSPAKGPEVTELMRVAQFVREFPRQDFRLRLKSDLLENVTKETKAKERNMTPTMTATTTYRPEGFRSLTPNLLVPSSAGLLNFMKDVFGASSLRQVPNPDGSIRYAELMIGDSMVELGENPAPQHGPRTTPLHVYVPDVDAVYARALAAGATSLHEVIDHEYGERGGSVRDAAGNHWYIATAHGAHHIPEDLHSVNLYLHPKGTPEFIDFLKRAFGAEEQMRHEWEGSIAHARLKIGDTVLEMGEAHDPYGPMPCAIHLYVPDTDAAYRQALAAGATSVAAPMDAHYGDRTATVNDPQGNQWYIATRLQK